MLLFSQSCENIFKNGKCCKNIIVLKMTPAMKKALFLFSVSIYYDAVHVTFLGSLEKFLGLSVQLLTQRMRTVNINMEYE